MDASNTTPSRTVFCLATLAILSISTILFAADEKPADKKEGTDKATTDKASGVKKVVLKGLTLQVSSTWTKREPRSRLRLAEFEIPPVDGDHEPAELTVFQFGGRDGGDAQANIQRWIKQVEPAGRKASAVEGTATTGKYQLADVIGNYKKAIGPPIQQQFEVKKGWRVLNVRLEAEAGLFFLKLAGPEKTVNAAAEAFRKSFGAEVTREKEFPLEKVEKE